MDIHEAVRRLRSSLGLSQQALATRLDLSISTIQKYEKNRVPDLRSLIALWNEAMKADEFEAGEVFFDAIRRELWIVPDLIRGLFYATSAPATGDAIRRLREKVGSSKQLADLVGWPAHDVAQWEKQPPGGLYILMRLAVLAKSVKEPELERFFRDAAAESVSEMNTQSLDIRDPSEWAICKAALIVLHDSDNVTRDDLLQLLLPIAEEHLRSLTFKFTYADEFVDAYLAPLKAQTGAHQGQRTAPKYPGGPSGDRIVSGTMYRPDGTKAEVTDAMIISPQSGRRKESTGERHNNKAPKKRR